MLINKLKLPKSNNKYHSINKLIVIICKQYKWQISNVKKLQWTLRNKKKFKRKKKVILTLIMWLTFIQA